MLDPKEFIITRKRKKYKFALFANSPLCFEFDQWQGQPHADILEIGAGTGLFGVALAEAQPDLQIVAVDVKADRLQAGAYRAAEKGLTNIRFLRARADQLPELFAPDTVKTIWVTFPDPFPKDRMAKHRLTHPQFLRHYQGVLAVGGALHFKTDAPRLFEWSLERLVENQWILSELSFDLHESKLAMQYKIHTTYEKRYTGEGLSIHFVKAIPPQR
jgi:tRNA (guanine-N7-)-methyltransferase